MAAAGWSGTEVVHALRGVRRASFVTEVSDVTVRMRTGWSADVHTQFSNGSVFEEVGRSSEVNYGWWLVSRYWWWKVMLVAGGIGRAGGGRVGVAGVAEHRGKVSLFETLHFRARGALK